MALFCKPGSENGELLYQDFDKEVSGKIAFRGLKPDADIEFLHTWVNLPYSKKYWQLDGSLSNLYSLYRDILDHPDAHSFIGLYNDQPVCQVDLYKLEADELGNLVEHDENDCGLHLLMQPPRKLTRGLTQVILRHFLQFYFSFQEAGTLYAEPDHENILANRLAANVGFHFQRSVHLSYKLANLYSITKDQFHAKNQGL